MDNNYQQTKPPTNGLAIASLILGIIAIPASCCYGAGIIFGIIAIVLGVVSKRQGESMSGMAIAGIICSVIGIIAGICMWIMIVYVIKEIQLNGGLDVFLEELNSYYY